MGNYWSTVEPVWDAIDIGSPEVFRETFDSAPRVSGLMFAAHFCQSELCNEGFHQFFWNSTGVLAPEAVEGFREIGQSQIAALIESAMNLVGSPYPRDREEGRNACRKYRKVLSTLWMRSFSLLLSPKLAALRMRLTVM